MLDASLLVTLMDIFMPSASPLRLRPRQLVFRLAGLDMELVLAWSIPLLSLTTRPILPLIRCFLLPDVAMCWESEVRSTRSQRTLLPRLLTLPSTWDQEAAAAIAPLAMFIAARLMTHSGPAEAQPGTS